MLVGYNKHTIYRVFIEKDQKVIRVKDLRIFEDARPKEELHLVYEGEKIDEQGETNGDSLLMPPQGEQADKGSSMPHTKQQEPNGQSPVAQVSQRRGRGRRPMSKKSLTILTGPSKLGSDRSTPPENNALQRRTHSGRPERPTFKVREKLAMVTDMHYLLLRDWTPEREGEQIEKAELSLDTVDPSTSQDITQQLRALAIQAMKASEIKDPLEFMDSCSLEEPQTYR